MIIKIIYMMIFLRFFLCARAFSSNIGAANANLGSPFEDN